MPLLLNFYFIVVLALVSAVFEVLYHLAAPIMMLVKGYRRDDIYRIKNAVYGKMMVRASWPILRVKMKGAHRVPKNRSCVFVYNHPSMIDVFFAALVPHNNLLVFVRSWPFKLKLFGWSMKLADYINSEATTHDELVERGVKLAERNVSFVVFPEGHRSRDGKLHRFYSGAFYLSINTGSPVIPVVMSGVENFFSTKFPFVRPTNVTIEMLDPVYPENFQEGQRHLAMRKHVEGIYREYLGEPL